MSIAVLGHFVLELTFDMRQLFEKQGFELGKGSNQD